MASDAHLPRLAGCRDVIAAVPESKMLGSGFKGASNFFRICIVTGLRLRGAIRPLLWKAVLDPGKPQLSSEVRLSWDLGSGGSFVVQNKDPTTRAHSVYWSILEPPIFGNSHSRERNQISRWGSRSALKWAWGLGLRAKSTTKPLSRLSTTQDMN